jgi:hypothetical protein
MAAIRQQGLMHLGLEHICDRLMSFEFQISSVAVPSRAWIAYDIKGIFSMADEGSFHIATIRRQTISRNHIADRQFGFNPVKSVMQIHPRIHPSL